MPAVTWLSSWWRRRSVRPDCGSSGILTMFWRRTGPRSRSRPLPISRRGTSTNCQRFSSRGFAAVSGLQKSGWHRFLCNSTSSRSRRARIYKDYSTLLTRQQHFHTLPQTDGKEVCSGIHMRGTPKNIRSLTCIRKTRQRHNNLNKLSELSPKIKSLAASSQ